MNVVKKTVTSSLVLVGALLACVSAQAACPSVTSVQRRIVEHASGDDMDVLRSFVWKTAIVYRINMVDVRNNLDNWRSAVECQHQAAAAEQAVPVAASDEHAAEGAGAHVAAR